MLSNGAAQAGASGAGSGGGGGGITVADLAQYVQSLKVAQLKDLIKAFNENLPFTSTIRLTGRKPELTERVIRFIEAASMSQRHFQNTVAVMAPLGLNEWINDARKRGAATNRYVELYGRMPGESGAAASSASSAGTGSQVASPAPVRPAPAPSTPSGAAPPNRYGQVALQRLRFWPSPFYEPLEYVSSIVQVPDAPPPGGRRSVHLAFSLTQQQKDMVKDTHTYQLRLFCTTFEHYMAAVSTGRYTAPVEFPASCDVRVNDMSLGVSLRGSKKHPGRVSPPNLNRNGSITLQPGRLNHIDMWYANTTNRHALVVALCRIATAEQLTARVKQQQYRTKEEVVERLRLAARDDEIQTGASTLRLTCPLTYMRMNTPCRANTCDHIQCFDAHSFFAMNEQSPLWTCPVCNKGVKAEDLRMDGYVEDILKRVPEDLEAVLVEPDGSWHSADDRYTSESAPLAPAAPTTPAPAMPLNGIDTLDHGTPDRKPDLGLGADGTPASGTPTGGTPAGGGMPAASETGTPAEGVFVLDDAMTPPPDTSSEAPPADVIDLTLSDDD